VPSLRAVTWLMLVASAMIGVAVLAGCGTGAVDVATVRDRAAVPPPETRSQPPAPTPSMTSTLPPPQLVQAARDAFARASSVHVAGTAVRGQDAYVLDVRLAGEAGGTATIETSGQTVDVTRIGDVAYVGGDLPFWRSVTGNETQARRMVGSYVRTRVSDPNFGGFVGFTQPSTYAAVLPEPAAPATPADPTTIRGAPVVGVRDTAGTTLYVAATGPAYPVRLDGLTSGQVVFLDFADYGSPVRLQAPSNVRVIGHGPGS
jgi:hypothetical protein